MEHRPQYSSFNFIPSVSSNCCIADHLKSKALWKSINEWIDLINQLMDFEREKRLCFETEQTNLQVVVSMTGLSPEKILEAAIEIEQQSYTTYTTAQKIVKNSSSKRFLEELAQEELKHKEKLLSLINDKNKIATLGSRARKIEDLKIVDVMKDTSLSDDANYQRILVYAAKREKATHDYYNSLAIGLEGTEIGEVFSKLAQEELIHKSKLEREYDDYVLKEN